MNKRVWTKLRDIHKQLVAGVEALSLDDDNPGGPDIIEACDNLEALLEDEKETNEPK